MARWVTATVLWADAPGCPCRESHSGPRGIEREFDISPVQIFRESGETRVEFTGALFSAPDPSGPWTLVPGARSPHRLEPIAEPTFFRSRQVFEGGALFGGTSIVPMSVRGPLQKHFDLALAGTPDGIFPPKREKPYFDGAVSFGGTNIAASLRVRGNSSLQECPFPKLKLKVSKETRVGTPFAEAREIKVGTHCAEGGRGGIGRLRDERATYREAVAYEVMETMGFLAPRVRRAVIAFEDTSEDRGFGNTGWQITRAALLLEDIEVLAERVGGHALTDAELAALTKAEFRQQTVLELQLLHALLGNWDYGLSLEGRGLWNTDVIQFDNGTYRAVPGDFDLASWVTERVSLNAPWDYFPELPDLERQMKFQVSELRGSVGQDVWQAAVQRYQERKSALEEKLRTVVVDEEGRANMQRHLTAFFGELGAR